MKRDPKDNGVYPLFPTPVLQANKIYTPTKKEMSFINNLKRRTNTGKRLLRKCFLIMLMSY